MHQQVAALEAAAAEARAALAAERRAAGDAAVQLHGLQVANKVINVTSLEARQCAVQDEAQCHICQNTHTSWSSKLGQCSCSSYCIVHTRFKACGGCTQRCRGLCQSQ